MSMPIFVNGVVVFIAQLIQYLLRNVRPFAISFIHPSIHLSIHFDLSMNETMINDSIEPYFLDFGILFLKLNPKL